MSDNEKKVFSQEVNKDDLRATAGGAWYDVLNGGPHDKEVCGVPQQENCIQHNERNIYGGKGFPNCAATVGDGSRCGMNDACVHEAVYYYNMEGCAIADCRTAWR